MSTAAIRSPRSSRRKRAASVGVAAARALPDHFTKTAILAAASKVFHRHGVAAARVEDILIAAKIARRTFYKYFSSKEDVVAAIHEFWTGELIRLIHAARDENPGDPLAGIRAGIEIFLGLHADGSRSLREIVELAMRSDSALTERRRWFRAEVVRFMDDSIRALDGRRLDPFVYYGLLSALEGLSLELASGRPDTRSIERAKKVMHALVETSLGLPNAPPLPHAD